jgi:DNA helicase HerA-like ATPase
VVKDASNLQLPFWLFKFAEFTEVIFRGQKGHEPEAELLRDMVAEAKERFYNQDIANSQLMRRQAVRQGYTADSPVPYRLIDLFKIIDERLGLLDGKQEKPLLKSVKERLASISRDPRFDFMFGNANTGGDRLQFVITELFRVPIHGRPISIVDMSALPSEVVSSVVSVLCRMAFDLAISSQGALQTLVVCEEAHRYVPANSDSAFWPTRQAIARIAKEGRKYGVYLAVITQRPSELDQTIISQCNTIFSMRLSNIADQKIIGGALTNGAQSAMQFLASIANREAIAFGEGIRTPMRLTFETIAKEMLPGSHIYEMQEAVRNGKQVDILAVIRRMRLGEASIRAGEEASISDLADTTGQRDPVPGAGSISTFADHANGGPARSDAPPARSTFGLDAGGARLRDGMAAANAGAMAAPSAPPVPPRANAAVERLPAGSLINAFRNKV